MHVSSAISGNGNSHKNFFPERPELGKWTRIEISQEMFHKKYIFKVIIGGKQVYSIENNQPAAFTDVKLYISDPWYKAQPGFIRALTVQMKGMEDIGDVVDLGGENVAVDDVTYDERRYIPNISMDS